MMHCENIE